MSEQVQCPNCGGFRTEDHGDGSSVNIKALGLFILVTAIIEFIYVFLHHREDNLEMKIIIVSLIVTFISMGVAIVLGLFTFIISLVIPTPPRFFKIPPREDGSIKYSCHLCGYRWLHSPHAPGPQINVNRELIRLGEERLRREEEERE